MSEYDKPTKDVLPQQRSVGVNISLPLYVLDKLDEVAGGHGKRSQFVVEILKRELKLT